jgi:hypothetical protein
MAFGISYWYERGIPILLLLLVVETALLVVAFTMLGRCL